MKVGLEVLRLAPTEWIPARANFGLVANSASVMSDLRSAPMVLWDCLGRGATALFNDPFSWRLRATAPSPSPATHLHLARHAPEDLPRILPKLDLLIFDLQDVGCTFFYLPAFLRFIMHACGAAGVNLLVLDRPNPLGGMVVEGPRIRSDTGDLLPPVVHGLTPGELARWLLGTGRVKCQLDVVPMRGWRRSATWGNAARTWIPPSPSIPSPTAALLYPACGLLRATNMSCGRGTPHPFELFGAPWQPMYELVRRLQATGMNGASFRSVIFRPDAWEWAGQVCVGAQIYVLDPTVFRILRAGLQILSVAYELSRDTGFAWRETEDRLTDDSPAETHMPYLHRLMAERIRPWTEAGGAKAPLEQLCMGDREQWLQERRAYLLYPEQ